MTKRTVILLLAILLVASLVLNLFLYAKTSQVSLNVRIGRVKQYDPNGEISVVSYRPMEDHYNTQIILDRLLNLAPLDEEAIPDSLPDGMIQVFFGSVGYPYTLWLDDGDRLILKRGETYYCLSENHNGVVALIRDLVTGIDTRF